MTGNAPEQSRVEAPSRVTGRQTDPPPQSPTIIDVAAQAGVSVSTVSRVLNGRSDVATGTRAKVEHAIRKLGFAPRVTAQRLASRRSQTLSLLFPAAYTTMSNHDLDFVIGAADATSGRDYFFNLTTDPVDPAGLLAMFRSGLVDGVILMQITATDWRVELLEQHRLPAVLIGRTETPTTLSWVDFDFEAAVLALYDYLVSIGHTRIGFVGRPRHVIEAGLGVAVRLQRGHERAVRRHGLTPRTVPAELDPIAAGQAALHLLDTDDGVTALVATHGPSTLGILRALDDRGVRVPQDVSVATIATPRVADLVLPSLTIVPFPSAQLGYQAASALVRQLDDHRTPRTGILLPATVSVRATTAPPRT